MMGKERAGFTHICTQCNNVFVGTMEDTTCPNCKAKAEHTVQHACFYCGKTWDSFSIEKPACPYCSGGKALEKQEGGSHYKDMKIQPVEFIHANNIPFIEASCIKYLCRWRKKGGVEDLKKVVHFVQMLIELEGRQ